MARAGGQQVGSLYYDVTLDTSRAIAESRRMQQENSRTKQSFDSLAGGITKIVSAIQIYAAAMAVVKAAQMADDVRLLGARVDVAAGSIERGTEAMRELQAISVRTRSAVGDNAQVFARLNQSILQLGGTQRDTLNLTELLGQAITVSGASAAEKSASMIQFAQAIGSGKLAGDELRSLLENAPYLMQQLANGLGKPIGALKQLGEEGKLTSDVVITALGKAAEKIEADFKKMPITLDSAMTVAADAFRRFNEASDSASGRSLVLTGAVQGVGEVMDLLAISINKASDKQDALGKSTVIQTWKDNTVTAFSYVLDAADLIVGAFQRIGLHIYRIGAAAVSAAKGNFSAARDELKTLAEEIDAISNRPLAGQRIRQQVAALATGTDGSDRLDRAATGGKGIGGRSTLRSTTPTGEDKFDDATYLAQLEEKTVERFEKIDAIEREAMVKAKALLDQGKITRATYEKAVTLIHAAAANERRDLALKEGEDRRAEAEKSGKELAEEESRSAKARAEVLIAATFDAERAIALTRDEAIRAADDGYRRGVSTFEEAEAAKVRAALNAAQQFRQLEATRSQVAVDTLQLRAGTGGVADQEALIQAQMEQRLRANEDARSRDIANAQLYADLEVEIIADAERRKIAARYAADQLALQSASSTFSSLAQMAQAFGGESDRSARVLFAISKAFAIADAIVKIQQGVASAMALPYPANIAAAAGVAAQGASIVGIIKGTNFGGGRMYGGPAAPGSMYQINETGRPEVFTAGNGSQFLLPTAGGNVTAADKVGGGGGGATTIELRVINQMPGAQVSQRQGPDGRPELVIAEVAAQISERRGEIWRALGTTNVRGQQ